MARKKFIRRNHDKYKRLGGRRKKLIWRRPKGIHSKMRERRRGYPARPEMGMKKPETKKPALVRNFIELSRINKGGKVILAKVGRKLRLEIEKKAKDLGIKILNERKFEEKNKTEGKSK